MPGPHGRVHSPRPGRAGPELSPTKPGRLGAWCRTVRAVLVQAGSGECPTHVLAKAHRVADRITAPVQAEPAGRKAPTDLAGAMRQVDLVIAWCDGLGEGPAGALAGDRDGGAEPPGRGCRRPGPLRRPFKSVVRNSPEAAVE